MDDKTPPKDCLAPYLNSSNINNVIKLAARIPDKVRYDGFNKRMIKWVNGSPGAD